MEMCNAELLYSGVSGTLLKLMPDANAGLLDARLIFSGILALT
jgi:hypothetical protein